MLYYLYNLKEGVEMGNYSFIFFVDGDNCPQMRIKGIEQLMERDEIHVFESDQAVYFNQQRQQSYAANTKASISFELVKKGKDSVDFAIGMAIARRFAARDPNPLKNVIVILVSGDKHFEIIAREALRTSDEACIIERAASVESALERFYLARVNSAELLNQYFIKNLDSDWVSIYINE